MNDDVISNDEWPLGYNSGMHSFDRMNHLRRNDSLNMQSPPIHGPRAIRGSSPYSDCSSPTRESHALFGLPRAITNTRSNSPVYNADPTFRDFKTFLPATEQELANICQLHALRHATSSDASSQYAAAHGHISRLMQCEKGQQMLSELFKSMQIQQQLSPKLGSQSWPSSPQVDNSNEFNFSAMSSTGSSNGSSGDKYGGLYGRNYYGNVNTEQALFEEAARKHRSALASMKQENCPCYSGEFPIRENKNPTYSVKVFLGGVPWDITEENLMQDFSRFGRVTVEWPKGVASKGGHAADFEKKDGQKKGYVYVIFEGDKQVKALLAACTQDLSKGPDTLFYPVSSKKFKLKLVQVIPWAISDSNHVKQSHIHLDPKCTVFVGALHGLMHAEFLFNVFDSLFQGVMFAGIDTDKFKYPIGSARVMFNNKKSYMRAVNAQFVDIKTQKFQKTVQVDPYLEDSPCTYCHNQQGPYFCKNPNCFCYFCHNCWQLHHVANSHLASHQPLMRNSKTNGPAPAPASSSSSALLLRHQQQQRVTSLPGGGQAANSSYCKYGNSAAALRASFDNANAGGDLIRGNLE